MKRFSHMIGMLRCLVVGLVAVLSLALTAPASAQFARAAGIIDISQPEYLSRDLIIFADGLRLDETQRVIVESVYDQYVRDFKEGWASLQDEITAVSQVADQGNMDQRELLGLIFEPFQSWRERRNAMGDEFLQNVQLILNTQQIAEWEDFLRRLRREKLMRKGQFDGEDLDLFAVIRDMHLSNDILRMVEPTLDAYAIEIGDALERRERALEERSRDLIGMLVDEDADQAARVVREQVQLRLAIRATNDRFIEDITAALPGGLGQDFRVRALRKGYPSVYQKTQADRMLEAALKLENLDATTRDAIIAVSNAYLATVAQVNERLFDSVRQSQPDMEIRRAEAYASHVRKEPVVRSGDPSYPLFHERTTIVQDHIMQLKAVLTLAQFAELPGAARYLKKEITEAQQAINEAERQREKEAYANEREGYQRAKDMLTGNQAAKRAREARKKQKGGDEVPE